MGRARETARKATTALERIDDLENSVQQIFQALGSTFNVVENRFNGIEELLSAVVTVVGTDPIAAAITEARKSRSLAASEGAKAQIAEQLQKGNIIAVDKVGPESFVVGIEVSAEGKTVGYGDGRQQLYVDRAAPEIQERLLDKAVGDTIETLSGGKFTINEIYEQNPNAPANDNDESAPALEAGAEDSEEKAE